MRETTLWISKKAKRWVKISGLRGIEFARICCVFVAAELFLLHF